MSSISWQEDKVYSRRKATHPVIRDCVERKLGEFKEINGIHTMSCLELGAGDGHYSILLNQYVRRLKLIDKSELMLKSNPVRVESMIASIENYPVEQESFDIVFEANVLHHLDDDRAALESMFSLAKKYVIIIEPNRNNPLTFLLGLLKKDERKSLLFNKRYILNLMPQKSSFELISHKTKGLLPPNKCPVWFWQIFRWADGNIPLIGLDHVYIFKKREENQ